MCPLTYKILPHYLGNAKKVIFICFMIIETRFFIYKSYLTVISIFQLISVAAIFYLECSGRGVMGDEGSWASGTEVPQLGPGAVLVVIWGKASGSHGYSVIL